jgi:pimeloyl-ACP methyl ester carboxylesterase
MRHGLSWLSVLLFLFLSTSARVLGQDAFFDSSGIRIRYRDVGVGDPVVLIHGQGNRIETWMTSGMLPDLAKDHRVIALDLRGHGESGKPHEPTAYGPNLGQDVVRLMDHLKIARAHVVAYSAGCSVTVQLLTISPQRFLTATLIAGYGRRLPSWTPAEIETDEAEARDLERNPQENNDAAALAAMIRAWRDMVVTAAKVEAIKVPLLAIVGSADPNLAGVQEFKRQKPALEVVVVEGATHGSPGDTRGILRQAQTRDAWRQFLAAHP